MYSMLCPKAAQLRSLFGTDKMPKCYVLRILFDFDVTRFRELQSKIEIFDRYGRYHIKN